MRLKILCSGHLIRYPLGGHSWHHLQYLVGFKNLGHDILFFEHYGWSDSCYDPARDIMTSDPSYGIAYLRRLLEPHGLSDRWCYLAEDGSTYGLTRARLSAACREADIYFNLDNINWIPELEECRRRVLIDADPVFTQIGVHGMGGPFSRYDGFFTYGENIHQPGCDMPSADVHWLPTRQPIVPELWPVDPRERPAPFSTVMNWSPFGDRLGADHRYGQKEREFEPFFRLPRITGEQMQIAVRPPDKARRRMIEGGWVLVDPIEVTRDPWLYQRYIANSRAEFSVAKHGYVSTSCGWFSDRSAGYLASGRPVLIQDTGFSRWLPSGAGVIPFRNLEQALAGIEDINGRYEFHRKAAREIAEAYFAAPKVLSRLLESAFDYEPDAQPRPVNKPTIPANY